MLHGSQRQHQPGPATPVACLAMVGQQPQMMQPHTLQQKRSECQRSWQSERVLLRTVERDGDVLHRRSSVLLRCCRLEQTAET